MNLTKKTQVLQRLINAEVPAGHIIRIVEACGADGGIGFDPARGGLLATPASVAIGSWGPASLLFFLAGPPGTGKSLAAATVLAHRDGAWLPVHFLEDPRFNASRLEKAGVLVVDNLGNEYSGPAAYSIGRFEQLVYRRHEVGMPTIITTNLDFEAICARYGARLASRMKQQCQFVVAGGPDLRGADS